jgi:hypothetical protein
LERMLKAFCQWQNTCEQVSTSYNICSTVPLVYQNFPVSATDEREF